MKLTVDRNELFPALSQISNVVERQQMLPVLANVFIKHVAGKITLITSDLEMEISKRINSVKGDDGEATVSARKLVDIARMLNDDAVISLVQEGDTMLVSSGRSRYKLDHINPEDFPRLETDNEQYQWEESFTINKVALKMVLDKTAFAMAIQDIRFYLNGILFRLEQDKLTAIATDGHRLAQTDTKIPRPADAVRQLIVPRKAVAEMQRFLDGEDDVDDTDIAVEVSKNHLKLTQSETVFITKLIDGKFPEFRDVLDTETKSNIVLGRVQFIDALNRVAVLTSERFKTASIEAKAKDKTILITLRAGREEAAEDLEADCGGDGVKSGYNVNYLIDVARAVTTEKIELNFQGDNGICIAKQPEESQSVWVIMPVRM